MKLNRAEESDTRSSNSGVVVSVSGSVVDTKFDAYLPPIYSVLRAGEDGRIVIEVLAQHDARHVRGIAFALTPGCTGCGICSCWPAASAAMWRFRSMSDRQ